MSNNPLITKFEKLVKDLNTIIFGDDDQDVILDDIVKPTISKWLRSIVTDLNDAIDIAVAAGAGANGWTAQLIVDESGETQQEINNKNKSDILIMQDSALILDSYQPAYSNAPLYTRFSTLAEAKAVYPAAVNLTDTIDRTVLQQAINDANGRRVITKSGREMYLNAVGPNPHGLAGDYCLVGNNAFDLISDGPTRTKLIVPTNTHGLIGMSDDISITNIHFHGASAPSADVGNMIQFAGGKRPKVKYCEFTNVADVAVGFTFHYFNAAAGMQAAMDAGTLSAFDMYQYGCYDYVYEGNIVNDGYGDGGIEIQAATKGVVRANDHKNMRGHGFRIVGAKDLDIYNNTGKDIGTAASFSAFLSFFSGALTRNGSRAWIYNENIRSWANNATNVKDAIHVGVGASDLRIFDNDIEAWNRGIYALFTNSDCRWGLKDSRIYRNKIRDAKGKYLQKGIVLEVGVGADKPVSGDLLNNVQIVDNEINFFYNGIQTINQTPTHNIVDSEINNKLVTINTSAGAPVTAINIQYMSGGDLSKSEANVSNGTELIVQNPTNVKFGKRPELKFTRSGGALTMQSRADLKTGQLVTVRTTGTLPAPLTVNTPYYLIVVDSKTVKLATSLTNAFVGTPVALTTDGEFHHYMAFI